MARADEPPNDARRNESGNHVAGCNVQPLNLVAGREGDKQSDNAPVENAHEQAPHLNRFRASVRVGGRRRGC